MTVFRYRALSKSGEIVVGTIDMPDKESAVARLRAGGHLPIHLDAERSGGLMALLNTEITPRDALSTKDRIVFTRSLATLTGAGLPLDRALEMAGERGGRRAVRTVSSRLLEAVRGGSGLASALDREASAFPPLYRSLVRAGEAGAALESTLARLADTLESTAKRQSELRSAMIYPAFLVVTAMGSVAILLAYVVPTFEPLLRDAGVEPPALTQIVIATGRLVEHYWLFLLAGLAGLFLTIMLLLRVLSVRLRWHRLALSIPVVGRLWREFETARLTRLLGTLLQNGVALPAALRLTRDALGNAAFADEVSRVIPEVEAGRGVADPLREGAILPDLALQLIYIGQESGQLHDMLLKTADIFDDEAKRGFDQVLAILTPALTLVMGVLIALIISSILFALFSINELAI